MIMNPKRFVFSLGAVAAITSVNAQSSIEPRQRQVRATNQTWAIACPAPTTNVTAVFDKGREEVLKTFKDWTLKFSLPTTDVEYKIDVDASGKVLITEILTPKKGEKKEGKLSTPESQELMISILKSFQPVEISVDKNGQFTNDPQLAAAKKSLSLTEPAKLGVCRSDASKFLWRGKRVEETVRADFPVSLTLSRPGETDKSIDLGSSVGYALTNRRKAIELMGIDGTSQSVCLFSTDLQNPTAQPEVFVLEVPEDSEPLKPAISSFRQMLSHLKDLNSPAPETPSKPAILGSAETALRSNGIEELKEGLDLNPDFSITVEVESSERPTIDIISHANIQLFEVSNVLENRNDEIVESKLTPVEMLSPMVMKLDDPKLKYEFVVRPKKPLKENQIYLLASPKKISFGETKVEADYRTQYFRTIKK